MFGPKKQTAAAKPNGVDNLIHKLKALPPAIDLRKLCISAHHAAQFEKMTALSLSW